MSSDRVLHLMVTEKVVWWNVVFLLVSGCSETLVAALEEGESKREIYFGR